MPNTLPLPAIRVQEEEVAQGLERTDTSGTISPEQIYDAEQFEGQPSESTTEVMSFSNEIKIGRADRVGSFPILKTKKGTENYAPCVNGAPQGQRLRMYIPPTNFGAVENGCVYRSSYPEPKNYDFIASLRIKTIITLVPEELPAEYVGFIRDNRFKHVQKHVPANKDGVIKMTPELIAEVLGVVMNRANHPILVHCNRGKHRTGCVIACFRKVQRHAVHFAVSEYRDYASPKCRPDDERFITAFDPCIVNAFAQSYGWLSTPPPEPAEKLDSSETKLEVHRDSIMEAVWTRLPSPSPSEDNSDSFGSKDAEPDLDNFIVEDVVDSVNGYFPGDDEFDAIE